MEIKGWWLALMGFLSLCIAGVSSVVAGGKFEDLYFVFYTLLIFFIVPVIALGEDRHAKKMTAFRLWLAIAVFSSFVFWDMPRIIFLYLLMMPVYVIVPVIVMWLILSGRWIRAKGAVMSILEGISLIYGFCGAALSFDVAGPAITISLLLSAFFYSTAGAVFFREENNAHDPITE